MTKTNARQARRTATFRQRHILLVVENVALARDHRLRKQVSALKTAGYRVSVICRSDPRNHSINGIRLHEYPAPAEAETKFGFIREYGYSWTMAALFTVRSFLTDRFDAIQVSGTPDIYFTIGAPFKLFGIRLVFDQRDLSPEVYEIQYGRRDAAYRLLCLLERLSYHTADHVITVNSSLKESARSRGRLPVSAITVVGNGPILAQTWRRRSQPALKHGKDYLCCWLGIMGPQDQVELALRSVGHLVHVLRRTNTHFAFIGDGESRPAAMALAKELGIADFVSFPGWMSEDEAFTYLSTAELGLEPNLEDIVSPVKGMEYMAFGLPFVAYDLDETRKLAGESAIYARRADVEDFARCIDALLGDPQLRANMADIGRRRVETEIAWEHQEQSYLEVYRRLLGDSRATDESETRQVPDTLVVAS